MPRNSRYGATTRGALVDIPRADCEVRFERMTSRGIWTRGDLIGSLAVWENEPIALHTRSSILKLDGEPPNVILYWTPRVFMVLYLALFPRAAAARASLKEHMV